MEWNGNGLCEKILVPHNHIISKRQKMSKLLMNQSIVVCTSIQTTVIRKLTKRRSWWSVICSRGHV